MGDPREKVTAAKLKNVESRGKRGKSLADLKNTSQPGITNGESQAGVKTNSVVTAEVPPTPPPPPPKALEQTAADISIIGGWGAGAPANKIRVGWKSGYEALVFGENTAETGAQTQR